MSPAGAKVKPFRTIGFWLAAAMALLQGLNAVRAFSDPVGFSAYMGLPIADSAQAGFVLVYGLRTAFIGLLIALLLATSRLRALALMAGAALVMPVGDAVLAYGAGAPLAIVARHAAIGLYVFAAFIFLRRASARGAGREQ